MSPIITAARLVAGAAPIHPDQKSTLPKIAGAYLLIARLAEPLGADLLAPLKLAGMHMQAALTAREEYARGSPAIFDLTRLPAGI